jgi:glyoxylase I family protein
MPSVRTDHMAFSSFDARATHRFYTDVMGFPLVHAQSGPSSTWGKQYLLTAYAIGDGRAIDFFEHEGMRRPEPDGLPHDIRHVGLAAPLREDLGRWKARLDEHGVRWYVEDHGDDEHLCFSDPNGVLFELTAEEDTLPTQEASMEALTVVERWASAREGRSPS